MKCPACGRQLEELTVDGITVDACSNGCGGIWFDQYELEKVDEQHESAGEQLLDIKEVPEVIVDQTRRRRCPRCGEPVLMRHYMSVKKEVQVDECPVCAGMWLDHGELKMIRDQYATDEERSKAAREYFNEAFKTDLAKARAKSEEELQRARRFARIFRFICPSYYIPGKQDWGAF
jgi:hypothetical protein